MAKTKKQIKKGNPRPKASGRKAPRTPDFPMAIETFRDVSGYSLSSMRDDAPSCFNNSVNIHRYKITVELIDEPKEVLAARLQELWDKSGSHHDHTPLIVAAGKIGYALKGDRGGKRSK